MDAYSTFLIEGDLRSVVHDVFHFLKIKATVGAYLGHWGGGHIQVKKKV